MPPEPEEPEDQDPTETLDLVPGPGSAAGNPPGGYLLIVASGPQRGLHWSVGEGLEAGRNPEADIFLDDVTVSRHHAAFVVHQGKLVVTDLGSTNGTYVNGVRSDETELHPGDEVIIGRFRLVVSRDA